MLTRDRRNGLVVVAVLMAQTVAPGVDAQVDDASLTHPPDAAWPSYGRDYAETHYSPLAQITSDNVGTLAVAWTWDIPKTGARLEATPIVVDGVLYATGPFSFVFALDARTGQGLWQWDPGIAQGVGQPSFCCGAVNRGVAVYGNKVYVGLLDGRLVALNKDTGAVEWSVQTTPVGSDYSITGAPRVVRGNVIIGNGGAEYGVRGFVTAYDAETGEQAWRFYTVPGNPADGFENAAMQMAAGTWSGEWWSVGGGGTAWDGFAYDPVLDLLYIGTGNGSPWTRDDRSPGGGDNLFLSSIVAVRGETGEYVWHYQTTPGDDWDYTAVQPIMLLDVTIRGRQTPILVQAPKNGFFYVLDRITGQLISAQGFADDLTWANGVDPETGRPIEAPNARYGSSQGGVWLSPGPTGAHNWHPMAWNAETGLVYLPVQNTIGYYERVGVDYRPGQWNTGTSIRGGGRGARPERPELSGPSGALKAWDPATNREVWRVDTAGLNGGALSTRGNLVFWGTQDRLLALDARSGETLWEAEVGQPTATPMTYELDGRQYVTILAGSTPPRVWTFTVNGGGE
jgi:PQQ-dependent dehydrogenase (methanol/ethanol family)